MYRDSHRSKASQLVAEQLLDAVVEGERPLLRHLACHAALAPVLRPELLYQIRAYPPFQRAAGGEPLEIPWHTGARLLLSPAYREVGGGIYELDGALRDALLVELVAGYGRDRLVEVARFVLGYAERRLHGPDRELARVQRLMALVCLNPGRGTYEIASELETLQSRLGEPSASPRFTQTSYILDQMTELAALRSDAIPVRERAADGGLAQLAAYARSLERLQRRDLEGAVLAVRKLPGNTGALQIGDRLLRLPVVVAERLRLSSEAQEAVEVEVEESEQENQPSKDTLATPVEPPAGVEDEQENQLFQDIVRAQQELPAVQAATTGPEREHWLQAAGLGAYLEQNEAELFPQGRWPSGNTFMRMLTVVLWDQPRDLLIWLEYLARNMANPGSPEVERLRDLATRVRVERVEKLVTTAEFLRAQGILIEPGMPNPFITKAEQHDALRVQTFIANVGSLVDKPHSDQSGVGGTAYSLTELRDRFSTDTLFIFGPPGSSKTSIRMELARISRSRPASRRNPVLIVDIDIGRLAKLKQTQAGVRDVVVEGVLGALQQELKSQPEKLAQLQSNAEQTARLAALIEVFDYWPQLKLEPLAVRVREYSAHYGELRKTKRRQPPLELWLRELWEIVRACGFVAISLMIDRLDDVLLPNRTLEEAARCLHPLLLNQLLAPQGMQVAWKFFLNEDLYDHVTARLGPSGAVRYLFLHPWPATDLLRLIDRRLSYFGRQIKVGSPPERRLLDLCASDVDEALLLRLAEQAHGSPREFILLVERLVGRHCVRATSPRDGISRATIEELIAELQPASVAAAAAAPVVVAKPAPPAPDIYVPYEQALDTLKGLVPPGHALFQELLALDSRLRENIARARRFGETVDNRAARVEIIVQLNRVSLAVLGQTFNELIG